MTMTTSTAKKPSAEIAGPPFEDGFLHAYFAFDVAESIDLNRLQGLSSGYERAQLRVQSQVSPRYIQFREAPLAANAPEQVVGDNNFQTHLKIYPYGSIVIRFTLALNGSWESCAERSFQLRRGNELESAATGLLQSTLSDIKSVLNKPYEPLMEDYFVYHMMANRSNSMGAKLVDEFRSPLASLIVGEKLQLSEQEQEEILRTRFSYFDSDLIVVHWDAAFVLDTVSGAEPVLDILEFANTQLVEFRYYDNWLDRELDKIYDWDIKAGGPQWWHGGDSAARNAEKLRLMLLDLRELSDEANNALKITGDAFYARLYRGISSRFGLTNWHEQVETKLESADHIYRYMIDQAHTARSQFFEIIIIALIFVEILLSLLRH